MQKCSFTHCLRKEEITIDEIGEINDFIQTEAGNNTNIIMGVGENPALGRSISVTIIATGFNSEQQHEIVNTEAKKIIHTLEEEQPLVHDLTQAEVQQPIFEAPISAPTDEPIVRFNLEDDEIVTEAVQEVAPAQETNIEANIEALFRKTLSMKLKLLTMRLYSL